MSPHSLPGNPALDTRASWPDSTVKTPQLYYTPCKQPPKLIPAPKGTSQTLARGSPVTPRGPGQQDTGPC